MAIQKIKANKTASLTDLRNPMKVIKAAGNEPVAIMNRDRCLGYFVPEQKTHVNFSYVPQQEFEQLLSKVLVEEKEVLEYLKDK